MKRRKLTVFGAATDDPRMLINRAIRAAEAAVHRADMMSFREAAEVGWLAASSTADVVADRLGRGAPGGASTRRDALGALEKAARMRRGTFVATFEAARTILHGECFHGDVCSTAAVLGVMDNVKVLAENAPAAASRVGRSRRR